MMYLLFPLVSLLLTVAALFLWVIDNPYWGYVNFIADFSMAAWFCYAIYRVVMVFISWEEQGR